MLEVTKAVVNLESYTLLRRSSRNPSGPYRRRGRVGKGVGHLAHVSSYGVREVVSSNTHRGNIVG